MHRRSRRFACTVALGSLALGALLACKRGGSQRSDSEAGAGTAGEVRKTISAATGGVVSVTTGQTELSVIFPAGSLGKDTPVVMAPAPSPPGSAKDGSIDGFSVVQADTGKGPVLSSPVIVTMSTKAAVAPSSFIVRYHDGAAGFDVLRTKVSAANGITSLRAGTTHFTTFGGRTFTVPDPVTTKSEYDEYDWVIVIKDQCDITNGPMKSKVTLELRAVNTSGDIDGVYNGNATSTTTNEMSAAGGSVTAPFVTKFDKIQFNVAASNPPVEPVPAVRYNKYGKPVEPSEAQPTYNKHGKPINPGIPEWEASGSMRMTSSGVGTARAGGRSESTKIENQSTTPFGLYILGPNVALVVTLPQGALVFNGQVRGEKKQP